MKHEKTKEKQRYKRIAAGIVTSAAVVTIGTGLMTSPVLAHSVDGATMARHIGSQRKAPAWRVGLRSAEAKALGMTTADFKEARSKAKLSELIEKAGLTPAQFNEKVKVELTASWKAEGVSDKDIEARLAKLAKFQDRHERRLEKHQR